MSMCTGKCVAQQAESEPVPVMWHRGVELRERLPLAYRSGDGEVHHRLHR